MINIDQPETDVVWSPATGWIAHPEYGRGALLPDRPSATPIVYDRPLRPVQLVHGRTLCIDCGREPSVPRSRRCGPCLLARKRTGHVRIFTADEKQAIKQQLETKALGDVANLWASTRSVIRRIWWER